MFDFFRELETNMPQDGDQEMVSLMPNFDDDPEPYVEEKEAISIEPEIVPEPVVEVKKETKPEVSPTVMKERKVIVDRTSTRTSSKINSKSATTRVVEDNAAQKEEVPQAKPEISQEVKTAIKQDIKREIKQEIKQETKQETKQDTVEITEPVIEENPVRKPGKNLRKDRPVMQRTYKTKQGTVEIAYINYSKVRMSMPGQEVEIKEFASSKEAVDYYVEQMQKLEELYSKEN